MVELAGMVSMDEVGDGVISIEFMQLTKWGLIRAWLNLALVTSTPFAKDVSTATANIPVITTFLLPYIHQVNYDRRTTTSSDRVIADKVSASWLLYRES